ncbi:MATE family efflux transporter [Dethiothermospora halolimnae]|uniref:MATE family efflux transporter n=1 Tax=Dethiothermospora halolimnae TaxID=3114390 RepID=UPI003CCBAA4C
MEKGLVNKRRINQIWTLAWPLMLSQFLQTCLQLADTWFINRIGITEATGAVGIGTSILEIFIVFSQLIAAGSIALIARSMGKKDEKDALVITEQSLFLSLFFGTIIAIVCYVFREQLLSIFNDNKEMKDYAIVYLQFVILGVPFMFFNLTGRAILQARGDSKTPMIIFVIMNIINVVLDPILIFGLGSFEGLGFKGAAIATATSNIVAFIFMALAIGKQLFDGKVSKIIRNFKISIHTVKRILKIGFFSAIQAVSRPITGFLMFKIASLSGAEAVSAFTIGGRMFNLVFIFLAGLDMAISVLVGQNLGKKDIKEAENVVEDGLKLAIMNMIIFSIPYFVFPKFIMLLFESKNMEVVNIGVNYLRITYVGLIFVVFTIVLGGAFKGSGDTMPPMVSSLIANWAFKLPFAYILSQMLNVGSNGVWIAISLSVIIEALINRGWFKKGTWKYKKV